MNVLVADDDAVTRALLQSLISSWGYQVIVAADGNQAWEILNGEDPPRIAILDWIMPGKTGIEICSQCEKLGLPVYRILVTAKEEKQDYINALDNGAHDFQSKPIVPGILKSRITVGRRAVERTQELIRSARLAAVGRLVTGVAHNFNNINTPILLCASSILKKESIEDDVRQKVQKIEKAAEQAKELTEKLIALANSKRRPMTSADLNRLVREVIEIEAVSFEEANIIIEMNLAPIPETLMNEGDIQHVVMNLLKNSQDALIDRPEKIIRVVTGVDEDRLYLKITDTGCGIAANRLQKIFSLFYTEKGEFAKPDSSLSRVKGTGLGLYASKTIATEHGGDITVESEVGKGTTFTLWLPSMTRP